MTLVVTQKCWTFLNPYPYFFFFVSPFEWFASAMGISIFVCFLLFYCILFISWGETVWLEFLMILLPANHRGRWLTSVLKYALCLKAWCMYLSGIFVPCCPFFDRKNVKPFLLNRQEKKKKDSDISLQPFISIALVRVLGSLLPVPLNLFTCSTSYLCLMMAMNERLLQPMGVTQVYPNANTLVDMVEWCWHIGFYILYFLKLMYHFRTNGPT